MIYETKDLTSRLKLDIKEAIEKLPNKPYCKIIKVGNVEASNRYVKHKMKDMVSVGIVPILIELEEGATTEEIVMHIEQDISDTIFVQLPLPSHVCTKTVLNAIPPHKDVDGISYSNLGKLAHGDAILKPATPSGVLDILDDMNCNLEGKHCVILGRSLIVGKPLSLMLLERNATVTVLHSYSKNIKEITKQADVIISSIGIPKYIDSSFISDNTICIDVGISFNEQGKLCGDFNKEEIVSSSKDIVLTNVPNGVGLTTRTSLLKNILAAYNMKTKY